MTDSKKEATTSSFQEIKTRLDRIDETGNSRANNVKLIALTTVVGMIVASVSWFASELYEHTKLPAHVSQGVKHSALVDRVTMLESRLNKYEENQAAIIGLLQIQVTNNGKALASICTKLDITCPGQ